jgi:hypothetical protein
VQFGWLVDGAEQQQAGAAETRNPVHKIAYVRTLRWDQLARRLDQQRVA